MDVRFRLDEASTTKSHLTPSLANQPSLSIGRALLVMLEVGDKEWTQATLFNSGPESMSLREEDLGLAALTQAINSVRSHLRDPSPRVRNSNLSTFCSLILEQVGAPF